MNNIIKINKLNGFIFSYIFNNNDLNQYCYTYMKLKVSIKYEFNTDINIIITNNIQSISFIIQNDKINLFNKHYHLHHH